MRFPAKPPKGVVPASLWHVLHICENIRDEEIDQFFALTGETGFDPEAAAVRFFQTDGPKWSWCDEDGMPHFAGGYMAMLSGSWQTWMIGTDIGWKDHWRSATKTARWAMGQMVGAGAVRLQTLCLTQREQANVWHTNAMGLTLEGVFKKFGANGEDVESYVWLKEE